MFFGAKKSVAIDESLNDRDHDFKQVIQNFKVQLPDNNNKVQHQTPILQSVKFRNVNIATSLKDSPRQ